jgi:Asp-tRNA(Asn)/Glu-tRNA(Gln) amidotransferase C subunit
MEAEKSSFSHDQDTGEAEHSLCETIASVIQALEQIDAVGTQLFQALEKLAIEGETLRIRMR